LGVQALNKIVFFLLFSLGFFGKKEKLVVPRIQRAVVVENQAIIYTQPDFDAEQIMRLPNNRIIAISTKIYRPKNLFGSFYRIFINKPRKIRGYISEIDVLPQYKKTEKGYVLNEEYKKKEQVLKKVKTQLIHTEKKAVQPGIDKLEALQVSQEMEESSNENKTKDPPVSEAKEKEPPEKKIKQPTTEIIEDSEKSKESPQENSVSEQRTEA